MSTTAITNCTQCGFQPLTTFSCKPHLDSNTYNIRTHIPAGDSMRTIIYFVFLSEVLKNCGFNSVNSSANDKKTFLMRHEANEIFLRRFKRYLVFEKGATLTFQGNIVKSIIPPAPRGLNMITEYTLIYDLPSDLNIFNRKNIKTKKISAPSNHTATPHQQHVTVPYSHDYFYRIQPEYLNTNFIDRKYSYSKGQTRQRKCSKKKFYIFNGQYSNICLKRAKRNENWTISKLTVSQRMFYDLIEKWSLIHGFLPRYCFMRTLCESSELLLPYGHSLLHDIIHILLGYTKPWAFHHKIFGRSLRQRYSINECAKLYGMYCRVSLLDFITNVVHGSRATDFMR